MNDNANSSGSDDEPSSTPSQQFNQTQKTAHFILQRQSQKQNEPRGLRKQSQDVKDQSSMPMSSDKSTIPHLQLSSLPNSSSQIQQLANALPFQSQNSAGQNSRLSFGPGRPHTQTQIENSVEESDPKNQSKLREPKGLMGARPIAVQGLQKQPTKKLERHITEEGQSVRSEEDFESHHFESSLEGDEDVPKKQSQAKQKPSEHQIKPDSSSTQHDQPKKRPDQIQTDKLDEDFKEQPLRMRLPYSPSFKDSNRLPSVDPSQSRGTSTPQLGLKIQLGSSNQNSKQSSVVKYLDLPAASAASTDPKLKPQPNTKSSDLKPSTFSQPKNKLSAENDAQMIILADDSNNFSMLLEQGQPSVKKLLSNSSISEMDIEEADRRGSVMHKPLRLRMDRDEEGKAASKKQLLDYFNEKFDDEVNRINTLGSLAKRSQDSHNENFDTEENKGSPVEKNRETGSRFDSGSIRDRAFSNLDDVPRSDSNALRDHLIAHLKSSVVLHQQSTLNSLKTLGEEGIPELKTEGSLGGLMNILKEAGASNINPSNIAELLSTFGGKKGAEEFLKKTSSANLEKLKEYTGAFKKTQTQRILEQIQAEESLMRIPLGDNSLNTDERLATGAGGLID